MTKTKAISVPGKGTVNISTSLLISEHSMVFSPPQETASAYQEHG
jgi:hypothetical protein